MKNCRLVSLLPLVSKDTEKVIHEVVNGTEIIKFKAKDSKIVASPLCLGNIC